MLPRAADVVGRKPMFLLGLVLYFLVIIMLLFTSSLYFTYFILFIGGISETGRYYVAYVYCVEMMPKKFQSLSGLMIFVVFGCLQILFSIYFWFISKQWENMAYCSAFLCVASFVMTILYLPETPRFLFGKKKFDEARKVLRKIAVFNGRLDFKPIKFNCELKSSFEHLSLTGNEKQGSLSPKDEEKFQDKIVHADHLQSISNTFTASNTGEIAEQVKEGEKQVLIAQELKLEGKLRELLKNKVYLKNLIIMTVIWSFGSFAFFFIPFYLDSLGGNTYLFAIFSGAAELLASLACILVTRFLTLKQALTGFCIISIVSSFVIIFVYGGNDIYVAILILFANFGITSTFDVAYLINAELFPTIFLATAYGCCDIFGRFITITSPIVVKLEHPAPLIILVIFGAIAAVLSTFL